MTETTPPERDHGLPDPLPAPKRDSELVTIRLRRSHLNIAVALVIGFLAGFWLSELVDEDVIVPANIAIGSPAPAAPGAAPPQQTNVKVAIDGRPFKGPKDAKVTIVEFTDYQCPFCKRHFDEVLPTLLKDYGDDVRYVVKNFPVTQIHQYAKKAGEAAECAYDAGGNDAFWEMHDRLFENQQQLTVDDLKEHADAVGVGGAAFDSCLDDGNQASVVQKDMTEAEGFGVTGTPTFVINGTVYKGAANLEAFKSRIDLALEQPKDG
ncbi:MAG: DsbA family protein [Actinomycetota bacterium]